MMNLRTPSRTGVGYTIAGRGPAAQAVRFRCTGTVIRAGHFLTGVTAALLLAGQPCRAGVELRPGTVAEFASVEEGCRVLGDRDAFIQAMSQFDRCVRMKTSQMVSEAELLKYITNQVRAWSGSEQNTITNLLASIRSKLTPLNLPLPDRILLIKTTGDEEGHAAYTRSQSIVVPQVYLTLPRTMLEDVLIHELFHIFSAENASWRPALYSVIGFFDCGEVALPDSLQPLKITNPDAYENRFAIHLRAEDRIVTAMPLIYSKSATYENGELFDYLQFMLMEVELREGKYVPVRLTNGEPHAITGAAVTDYESLLQGNTHYTIHPDETLADNFVLVANADRVIAAPRVPHLLRAVLEHPSAYNQRLLAGWFRGSLAVGIDQTYQVEGSTDWMNWFVVDDRALSRNGSLDFVDHAAWIDEARFYRARQVSEQRLVPGATNSMVWIAPGSFTMGSPPSEPGRGGWEGPLTQAIISKGFWLGRYEVTQAEYLAVMGSNPSGHTGAGNLPVERILWRDATNYCGKLTAQERTAERLPSGYVYRLPTEAEWEYAYRAGTATPYPFGNDPDQVQADAYAWFHDNSDGHTHSVGTKAPNAWGLYDMHGNVHELCADWFSDAYPGGTVIDPKGPAGADPSGYGRVVRGGGYRDGAEWARSASRQSQLPDDQWDHVGFRIALAPAGP